MNKKNSLRIRTSQKILNKISQSKEQLPLTRPAKSPQLYRAEKIRNFEGIDKAFFDNLNRTGMDRLTKDMGLQEHNMCLQLFQVWKQDTKHLTQEFQLQKIKDVDDEKLIGPNTVTKFYNKYKHIDKDRQLVQLTKTRKDSLARIVELVYQKGLLPRKLNIVKEKGEQRVLDFHKLKLSKRQLFLIGRIIQHEWRFFEIDLSHNSIQDADSPVILSKLQRLKKINLNSNRIGKVGCQALSRLFLQHNCQIEEINLENNQISDRAAEQLFRVFVNYRYIRKVNMARNFIAELSSKSISVFLESNPLYLSQLVLHWNKVNEKCMRIISQGMRKYDRKRLKVLDLSWNNLGGQDSVKLQNLLNFLQINEVMHMDFSFCQLTNFEVLKITNCLAQMKSLVGFHLEGNCLREDNKKIVMYPLPIYSERQIRRIDGMNLVDNRNIYIMQPDFCQVCWVCEGWQQNLFTLQKNEETQKGPVFLHVDFSNFRGVEMQERANHYQLRRMVPLGEFRFFYSCRGKHLLSENQGFQDTNLILKNVRLPNNQNLPEIHLDRINWKLQQFKKVIVNQEYERNITCTLKDVVEEDLIHSQKLYLIRKKEKRMNEDFILPPFFFQESVFARFRQLKLFEVNEIIRKDVQKSNLPQILDLEKLRQIMEITAKEFETILAAYTLFSAVNYSNDCYSVPLSSFNSAFDDFPSAKKLTSNIIQIKYISSTTKATTKRKFNKEQARTMRRSNFIQILVRFAMEYDISKNNSNLLKYFTPVIKQFSQYERKASPMRWRKERYWNGDVHMVLMYYQEFTRKLFNKYTEFKAITVSVFKTIFKDLCNSYLGQLQLEANFLMSKACQLDQDMSGPMLDYWEFLEALTRMAEFLSLAPIYPKTRNLKWELELMPLYLKLQSLLLKLFQLNEEIVPTKYNNRAKGLFSKVFHFIEIQLQLILDSAENSQGHARQLDRKDIFDLACVQICEHKYQVSLLQAIERKKRIEEEQLQQSLSSAEDQVISEGQFI